jgi:hypothetical protein
MWRRPRARVLSKGDAATPAQKGPFRLVLLAALLLTAGTLILEFLLSYLLRAYLFSNIFAAPDVTESYNLLTSLVFFAFNPVLCFLVFYKIGGTSKFEFGPSFIGLLKNAFIGGVAGYALGFLGTIAIEALITSSNPVGAQTNWLLYGGQLALGLVRGGIDITFLAFAGVAVGAFRARDSLSTAETEIPPADQTSPV